MTIEQRQKDIAYVTASFNWMLLAFKETPGQLQDMIKETAEAFARIVQSYEGDIECLKRVQPVDKPTQMNSIHAPVDSVED